jgi:poly-gamma-glutamate synthesis protein (capsule biosynthesis protein)
MKVSYFRLYAVFSLLFVLSVLGAYFWGGRLIAENKKAKPINDFLPTFTPTPKPPLTTILFVGDVMLGRSVMNETLELGDSYYPFRKVADNMRKADLTFVNLENPIVDDCPLHEGGYTFCTTPSIAGGLAWAGVDAVSISNNHILNYGSEGLASTRDYLEREGITSVYSDGLQVFNIDGIDYGFLGFEYVFKPEDPEHLPLVAQSEDKVDILIVSVHWGDEYENTANSFQRNLAKKFIEKGADVVIGHHPHWVQDADCFSENEEGQFVLAVHFTADELRENRICPSGTKPVYYSLGNFIFDQMWSEETKKGLVVELTFDRNKMIGAKSAPVYIPLVGQPVIEEM